MACEKVTGIPYLCEKDHILTKDGTTVRILAPVRIIVDGEEVDGESVYEDIENAECIPCMEGASECTSLTEV